MSVLTTTVSARDRAIYVQDEHGVINRFALVRERNGTVAWRHDLFTETDGVQQWSGHFGRLTVLQVVQLVPNVQRDVLRWSREELEDGPDLFDLDIFARDSRKRALAVLQAEMDQHAAAVAAVS